MKKFNVSLGRKIDFWDVGARGDAHYPFSAYRGQTSFHLFEPDPEEFQRLKSLNTPDTHIYPVGLSSKEADLPLYLTKSRGCTSLYEPNTSLLRHFPDSERFTVEKIEQIKTKTIDSLVHQENLENIDFIKIDVQGAELDIIKGAANFFREHLIGLEIEVEFLEMYKKQPLFSEVDSYLRNEFGFWLVDLKKYYWKFRPTEFVGTKKGVLAFGDALYLRSPLQLVDWCLSIKDGRTKLEAGMFIAAIYGYPDYCLKILEDERVGSLLGTERLEHWKTSLLEFDRTFIPAFIFRIPKLASLLFTIGKLFQPTYKNWGTIDGNLGSKNRFGWWE